jgi:hypothetical protein
VLPSNGALGEGFVGAPENHKEAVLAGQLSHGVFGPLLPSVRQRRAR